MVPKGQSDAPKIKRLPAILRQSLTWDQGPKDAGLENSIDRCRHRDLLLRPTLALARGSNANTNGLLRQYFPKGSDLSIHSAEDLDWVAAELND